VKREREAQLAQAREKLARLTDEVELAVHTADNKLERMQQMLKVSEEVVALRSESNRVLQQGAAIKSQAAMATAQEYDAKALLPSQLDYSQAHDEFIHAMWAVRGMTRLRPLQRLTFESRSWQSPQATAGQ